MSVFVDTSALMAVLDADDVNHHDACLVWDELLDRRERLVTTNYVLLECFALVQSRFGLRAVALLTRDLLGVLDLEWVGTPDHEAGVAAVLAARRRDLSLVDCASFVVMHRVGVTRCFTFDRHFTEMGFDCLT